MLNIDTWLTHEDLMELKTIVGDYSKLVSFIDARCEKAARIAAVDAADFSFDDGWHAGYEMGYKDGCTQNKINSEA